MNIVMIFFGFGVGLIMCVESFLIVQILMIFGFGVVVFVSVIVGGVFFGKIMMKFSGGRINLMIGVVGVLVVLMSVRVVQRIVREEDLGNFIFMYVMGLNVVGVIGMVVVVGVFFVFLG